MAKSPKLTGGSNAARTSDVDAKKPEDVVVVEDAKSGDDAAADVIVTEVPAAEVVEVTETKPVLKAFTSRVKHDLAALNASATAQHRETRDSNYKKAQEALARAFGRKV